MKKLFKTLTVLATALALGFGFASCKNNDDDSSSAIYLYGGCFFGGEVSPYAPTSLVATLSPKGQAP